MSVVTKAFFARAGRALLPLGRRFAGQGKVVMKIRQEATFRGEFLTVRIFSQQSFCKTTSRAKKTGHTGVSAYRYRGFGGRTNNA